MLPLNRRGSHHTFRRQVTQETRRVSSLSSVSNRGILLHRYVRLDPVYRTTSHEMNIAKQIPVLRHRMFVLNELDINMCLNICWTGDALSYLVSLELGRCLHRASLPLHCRPTAAAVVSHGIVVAVANCGCCCCECCCCCGFGLSARVPFITCSLLWMHLNFNKYFSFKHHVRLTRRAGHVQHGLLQTGARTHDTASHLCLGESVRVSTDIHFALRHHTMYFSRTLCC